MVPIFWKGVLKTRDIIKWGWKVKVKNGRNTRFWEDIWVGDIPLKLDFPSLYTICSDEDFIVRSCREGVDGMSLLEELWGRQI